MTETFETFRERSLAAGADEAVERRWNPNQIAGDHSHEFTADAVVTEGEMWLTMGGETRHLRIGDTFHIDAGTRHSEKYGAAGAVYWVARRTR